jgi:hypothetical protein
MDIDKGGMLRLMGAEGVVIGCTRGALWITEEGDVADHLLEAGGRHRVRRAGLVLAEALVASAVWVCRPVRGSRARAVRAAALAGSPP